MDQLGFSSFFDACAGIGCFHLGIVNSAPSVNYRCLGMAEEDSRLRKLYLKISKAISKISAMFIYYLEQKREKLLTKKNSKNGLT